MARRGPDHLRSAQPAPIEIEPSLRTVEHEYRDADGVVVGKIFVHIRRESAQPHRDQLDSFLTAKMTGVVKDEYLPLEKHIISESCFPNSYVDIIESVVLTSANGQTEIDLFRMIGVDHMTVSQVDILGGVAISGFNLIGSPEPKNPLRLFVLLHEAGHKEQEKDIAFQDQAMKLSTESVSRGVDSPQVKLLERDANRRAMLWIEECKRRGVDLTGAFIIDEEVLEMINLEALHTPDVRSLAEHVIASGRMTIEQFTHFQLDQRGAYESAA